jgi:hypothetical protein
VAALARQVAALAVEVAALAWLWRGAGEGWAEADVGRR